MIWRKVPSTWLYALAAMPWAAYWPVYQQDPVLPPLKDGQVVRAAFIPDCSGLSSTDTLFELTVVRSDEATRKGLSNRSSPLGKTEGMLFVFEHPEAMGFWMKETLIPLQLVWVSPYGRVLGVQEMEVEKNPSKPTKTYAAPGLLSAAIELAPHTLKLPLPSPVPIAGGKSMEVKAGKKVGNKPGDVANQKQLGSNATSGGDATSVPALKFCVLSDASK